MSAQEPTQVRPENNPWGEPRWEQPTFGAAPNQPYATPNQPFGTAPNQPFGTAPNQPPVMQGELVGIRPFQAAPPSDLERVLAAIRTWVWPVFLVAALITGNWGSMFVTTLVVAIVTGAALKRIRRTRYSSYVH